MSALKEIAVARRLTINEFVSKIDDARQFGNLSSAIRLFVLAYSQVTTRPADDARQYAPLGVHRL